MQKLQRDSSYARQIGIRGKAYIHENFNPRTIGAKYEARLRKLKLA
jgi:hypothetical protein